MRKLGLTLLLAALATVLVVGCGEDAPKPAVTKLTPSAVCGVVPMRVDFRADATGGEPFPEPTGGNNWLQMNWDFGDGTTIENGTSVAYHTYAEADTYTVTVTATDNSGEQATRSIQIYAQADSLQVEIEGMVEGLETTEVEACQPLELATFIETCGFDPATDSNERFLYLWDANGSIYTGPTPHHTFTSAEVGEQVVYLTLEYPERSITRVDSLVVEVVPSPGTDLTMTMDWQPEGTATDTLYLDVASFPDTLTYALRVRNDGPGDAFNVTVRDSLHSNNRVFFNDAMVTSGDWEVIGNAAPQIFNWYIPFIAAGDEQVAEVTFRLEMAALNQRFTFRGAMDGYPCDADPGERLDRVYLVINSLP